MSVDPSEFLEDIYAQLGGLAERRSGVLEAVAAPACGLPDAIRFRVADDADPSADLLHIGHPVLEQALDVGRRIGRVSVRHVPGARGNRSGLEAAALKQFAFRNARAQFEPARPAAIPWAVFHYRVSYVWDEKREDLVRVGVDLHSGAVVDPVRLSAVYLEDGGLPGADRGGLRRALDRSRHGLEQAVRPRVDAFTRQAARYHEVERTRLDRYFQELLTDLDRRERGAPPERLAALREKRAQVELDRDTRRRELDEKFRVRVAARLSCLEVVDVPRLLLPLALRTKHASRDLLLSHSFLTHQLDPLLCEGCGAAGFDVYLCCEGHLACPACFADCGACRRSTCRACAPPSCARCQHPVCPRCATPCGDCGGHACERHRGECHRSEQPAPLAAPSPQGSTPTRKQLGSARTLSATPAAGPHAGLILDIFQDLSGWYKDLESFLRPLDEAVARAQIPVAERLVHDMRARIRPEVQDVASRLEAVATRLASRPHRAAIRLLEELRDALRTEVLDKRQRWEAQQRARKEREEAQALARQERAEQRRQMQALARQERREEKASDRQEREERVQAVVDSFRRGRADSSGPPLVVAVQRLLREVLASHGRPEADIASALTLSQRAAAIIAGSRSSPHAWAAALLYESNRADGRPVDQRQSGALFGVSGATVSQRAAELAPLRKRAPVS